MKNMTGIDRFLRLLMGVVLLEAAFFWLAGAPALVAYTFAAIMVITGVWGFCPLYRVLGIAGQWGRATPRSLAVRIASAVLLLCAVLGGSYASNLLTRKIFLEDFNAMNPFYKQTLFLTGKGERDKAITTTNCCSQPSRSSRINTLRSSRWPCATISSWQLTSPT